MMPSEDDGPVQLAPGWTATTQRAESSYGMPVYVADACAHGADVAHSLQEAVGCGIIQAVRAARGLSQQQAATAIGVSPKAVQAWEQGLRHPTGLYADAVARWLLTR